MESVSLAEPRRRQKWTLNPRGNMWSNDKDKFGQKLMEKMGWSQGKGLGAHEDGRVQHISVKLKDNNKGVGFEGHDDTWLSHQNDFQNVLAALNIEHGDAGKEMSEVEKKANLEEISKKSKRRVHYQKFVRGKDLKNYSADDLGCILGTKSEKVQSQSDPTGSPEEGSDESSGEDDSKFVQGGNYTDYFAKKMAELKARGKLGSVPSSWTQTEAGMDQHSRPGFGAPVSEKKPDESNECPDEEPAKKKKKSKKSKKSESVEETVECNTVTDTVAEDLVKKKKKSKKDKKKEEADAAIEELPVVKKKKSKKSKNRDAVSEDLPVNTGKKSKNENIDSPVITTNSSEEASEELKKKKSKKSKKEKVSDVVPVPDPDSGCEEEDAKYKKAKKIKKEKNKEKKTTYSEEEKENRKRKNKSKIEEESPAKRVHSPADPEPAQSSEDTKISEFYTNLKKIPGYGSSTQ